MLEAARETRGIVTVEEAIVTGGLGAAVASLVAQHQPVPMRILGVTGFAPTGSAELPARPLRPDRRRHRRPRPMSSPDAHPRHRPGHERHQGRARRRAPARSSRAARAPVALQHAPRPAGSSRTRTRSGRSVQAAVADCVAEPDARGRRRRPQHPARVAAAVGPRHRRAARADAQLAGPAHRRRLRAGCATHDEQVRALSGLPLDPMFSATKARWLLDAYRRAQRRLPRHRRLFLLCQARRRAT